MALSQKEVNQYISEALSSDGIKIIYAAIGHNLNNKLLYIMQMAAVYGVDSEFKSFHEWNESGQYIKRGQKAFTVYNQEDTVRIFTCDQLQKSENYLRKNKRTMQSLLDTLNRLTILKSTSEKVNFEDVQTAIRHYISESNIVANEFSGDLEIITNAIAGVIAYTTCDFTGEGFTPVGLPYSYLENARIIREAVFPCAQEIVAHIENEEIKQEQEKKEKANASHKPIITQSESTGTQTNLFDLSKPIIQTVIDHIDERKQTQNSLYNSYMELQEQNPDDVVFYRLGDFYEIMGDKAKQVAEWANITLTGRDVGLSERVPMCGIPYHALEKYVNLITQHSGVIIAEPEKEPIRIQSKVEIAHSNVDGLKQNIREWYSEKYPNDDAVEEIKADATFNDLNNALNNGESITGFFTDSVIRERAFSFLSEILVISYSDVYNLWLKSEEIRQAKLESEKRTAMVDASSVNSELKHQPSVNRFKQLTPDDKAFFDNYQQRFMREPSTSLWDEVQSCRTIANGVYEVSTAGHGGVMISEELAPYILSAAALRKGVRNSGYYCYEEDCDAAIPLRELWDKGILTSQNDYFKHFYVRSNRPEAVNGSVSFNAATEEEKVQHIEWWNGVIEESLKTWNKEYWTAYENAENISQPNNSEQDIMVDAPSVNDETEPHPYYNNSQTFTSITVNGAESELSELGQRLLGQGYSIKRVNGEIVFDISDDDMEMLAELIGNDNLSYHPTNNQPISLREPKVIIEWSENAIIDAFSGKELTLGFADKLIRDVYTSREMEDSMAEGGYDKTKYRLFYDKNICPLFRDAAKKEHLSLFPNSTEEAEQHYISGEFVNRIDSEERCGIIEQIEAMYSDTDVNEDIKAEYDQVKNEFIPYLKKSAEQTREVIEITPEYVKQLLSQSEIRVHCYTPSNYADKNGEICGLYEHTVTDGTSYIFIAPVSKFDANTATLNNSENDVKYVSAEETLTNWLDHSTDYDREQADNYAHQREAIFYQYVNQITLNGYYQLKELTFAGQPFKPYEITPVTALPASSTELSNDVEGVVTEEPDATQGGESFGGKVKRCSDNLAAISTLRLLEVENRTPTAAEREKLSGYVGWGGIPEIFDENNKKWEARRQELKSLLSESQYAAAKASVVNSFFTSDLLVKNIYAGLEHLGVSDNIIGKNIKILEPSMGIGAFIGKNVPPLIQVNANFTGVELDEITAKIAKKLLPIANIINSGLQNTSFEDNTFDIVVGNVPFGEYGVYDENFKNNFKIHDYFIAKSVQKVRSGGLVAVITSSGTMDKLDTSARKYIADRAELVGAIRLPNSAFKNANTDVMTDILFLRKREKQLDSSDEWINTSEYEETGLKINNYFKLHPEMVLGKLSVRSSQFGPKLGVVDGELSLNEALSRAIENLPENVFTIRAQAENKNVTENKSISIEGYEDLKNYCYEVVNGVLYQRRGDRLIDCTFTGKGAAQNFERAVAMIEMRKQVRKILNLQLASCTDEALAEAQQELAELYKKFVPKFGNINNSANTRCFREDADWALLSSIEKVTGEREVKGKLVKIYGKNDIFSKRTIRPYVEVKHVDNVLDALQVCKNNRNSVDIKYISDLTNIQPDEVLEELGELIYRNPEKVVEGDKYSGFELAEEYLSGDVKSKLAVALHAANSDISYKTNVAALETVQPEKVTADKIGVKIGARWIDFDIYQKFAEHILGLTQAHKEIQEERNGWKYVDLQYESITDEFGLAVTYPYDRNTNATTTYGTARIPAGKILEATLNLRPVTVYDTIEDDNGKKKRVVNKEQTLVAREKQQRIIDEFKDWIFADYDRRTYLEDKYNRLYNRIVLRQYDGKHLEFPGMNPEIKLNAHQKAAIYRSICQGGTLLHHPVGAGKTFTMCATAMKLKEYGLAKKPMIVVPNPIIEQFAGDFRRLYPNANLLIASEKDLQKENRKNFVAKVATGDWDAVIMMQSSFDLIRVSKEREVRLRQEELDKIDETIDTYSRRRGKNISIRRLEQYKRSVEKQIQELTDSTKFDDLINFEDLGVDYLFVDEAHNYKNKFFFTKMTNVAGLSSTNAHRASYLDFKIDYLNELHGGDKGVIFATGTPISNSMTEMYTMMSYLQKNKMRSLGFGTFDAWASTFGETVNSLELAPSGNGYRMKTRFAKFTNLPELLTLYNDFADVKEIGELGLKLPTAHKETVAIKPGADTEMIMEQIAQRAERIYQGGVDPTKDNMLKITSDGKKTALDVRLIDPELSDADNNKISIAATNIARIYHATTENLSTQIVFCDMSTPAPNAFESYVPGENFNVYCELKYKLIELGVNPDEIQFIHDFDKDKENLFRSVNAGKVRVLIGSTAKCGVGTNCQERLIALHHLDTPYRPADLEQREGRIIRQGNTNDNVEIYTYVTERTFDAYSYQILENKQRFISQIGNIDSSIREIEDLDEKTLSYAEVKALTASNPLIKRKFELESRLQDLRTLKAAYKEERYKTEKSVQEDLPWRIKYYTTKAEQAAKDINLYDSNSSEDFVITINGELLKRSEETAAKFAKAIELATENVPFARFAGFDIVKLPAERLDEAIQLALVGAGQYSFSVTETALGTLNRVKNIAESIDVVYSYSLDEVKLATQSLEQAKVLLERGFDHEEEIKTIQSELIQIDLKLNLDKQDIVVTDDVGDEQYWRLPDMSYGKNIKSSAFSISYGGEDTRYYENTTGISLKELCEKYISSDAELQEYGKPIDEFRFSEIMHSSDVDYTAQFDLSTNKVTVMANNVFYVNKNIQEVISLLQGKAIFYTILREKNENGLYVFNAYALNT